MSLKEQHVYRATNCWLARLNLYRGLRIWGWIGVSNLTQQPPNRRVRPWSSNRSKAGFVRSQHQQNLPSFAFSLWAPSCHHHICAVHVARHDEEF